MRTTSGSFFLAVFALLGSSHAGTAACSGAPAPTRSKANDPAVCAVNPRAIVSDACASFSTLDALNSNLQSAIKVLTQKSDFFSYYRLNLFNKECPFWEDEGSMCGNIACAVNTIENEEDIPLAWRAKELGKLQGPKAQHPNKKLQQERDGKPLQGELGADVGESCVVEYDDECDDRDFCVPEDEGERAKGDYVSLVDNPEKFTGYTGMHANHVWEAIYRENCFSKKNIPPVTTVPKGFPLPSAFPGAQIQASLGLKSIIKEYGRQQALSQWPKKGNLFGGLEFEDECLEKRVFYRIISGMHASISTHLCSDYLNQTTGQWSPNLQCYQERLHDHPERISNLYFNYALVLRAVEKARSALASFTFCSGDLEQDRWTKSEVLHLVDKIASGPRIYDESLMFQDGSDSGLKEDFRGRFRNVSRTMDCVGCDKCRLWGKVQTAGYGTALKILFEFDENDSSNNPPLRRTELVALINTLDRISSSISALETFRAMLLNVTQPPPLKEGPDVVAINFDGVEITGNKRSTKLTAESSFGEIFSEELGLIWRAVRWVLGSWAGLPKKVFHILLIELSRLWNYWLGLPNRPRTYGLYIPTKDEI